MLDIEQVKQRLDNKEDLLLLDVRKADEFIGEQGHVASATNIPLEELTNRLEELGDYEEKTIITICRTDSRSTQAAQLLNRQGFADVHVAKGGMKDWIKHGWAVQR